MSDVKTFLENINLGKYWPIFKENAITTFDRLFLVTPNLARELIQPVGDRIVFLEYISTQNKVSLYTEEIQVAEINIKKEITRNDKDNITFSILQESDIIVNPTSLTTNNNVKSMLNETKTYDFNIKLSGSALNSQSISDSDVQESIAPKKRHTDTDHIQDSENENPTPKKFCRWETKQQYENVNLKKILQEHIKDEAVLFYYKQHGLLNGKARGILLDIVANHMLKISIRPSRDAFALVSRKICQLFPTETEDTYYFKPYTNGPYQKNAAGKLVDKVRNTKTLLRKLSDTHFVCHSVKRDNQNDSEDSEDEPSSEDNENVEIAIRWLKISREPWPEVMKHWEITYDFRQRTLLKKSSVKDAPFPICDYYNEWEILSLPQGYTLNQLIFSLTLYLLPYMIPPKDQIKCDSGEKLKANISEAWNAFMLHANVPGDLIPAIDRRQKVAKKLKKRVQPFVAIVGPSVKEFTSCYVVIDNIKYKFDSIVKAFDVCFKAIHSLNTEYSYEAKEAWLFVQQALYGIYTSYDKKNSAVAALVKSFQVLYNISKSSPNLFEVL
ncbi:uncharacterized protein LOC116848416 isoform X2 [Odontomachus brunneus]|uniref:uncharacterized protein LOC116848416 isoform X2 n=1 Tax=Odontomachus brunneus TaxID=486640 RepID=UPI0013F1C7C5|nr:uncharacterized protein LOC116848416 isoform X2 [Odontomachus brunneus]